MVTVEEEIKKWQQEIIRNKITTARSGVPLESAGLAASGYPSRENIDSQIQNAESYFSGRSEDMSGNARAEFNQLITHMKKLRSLYNQPLTPTLFTYNYTSIYGTFSIEAASELEAYSKFQNWLKEKESQVTPTPAPIETPLVTEPTPIETPLVTEPDYIEATPIITPTVDDSINTNMVTQQVINFNIINGRAVGSIKFVATNSFNPYYYNKDIINLVQFKTPNGVTLLVKQNRLRFTQTERDEVINYDESIQENTRVTVESFVWEWVDKPAGAFSNKYIIDISEAEPPKPMQAGFMGAGVAGAIAGLILLGFVADHKRAK